MAATGRGPVRATRGEAREHLRAGDTLREQAAMLRHDPALKHGELPDS